MKQYDVIVLGAGAAGLTCAIGASKIGKKTLIIERDKLGGECTWSGCVPSKAFIASRSLEEARKVSQAVFHHESPEVMKGFGIDTLKGEASFVDAHTLRVDGEDYTAKNFIIAAGAFSALPPVKGVDNHSVLTTERFFQLEKAPKVMVFVGGGVISLELAFPLAKSGTKVTILEKADRLLPNEDAEVRDIFSRSLEANGIQVLTNVDVLDVRPDGDGAVIRYSQKGEEKEIRTEKILASAGRRARVEGYGLDKAGVEHSSRGIKVNKHMQTSVPHIYAAGDCVDGFRFSHIAGRHGEVITRNLAFPLVKASYVMESPPFIVFADPEYSRCGKTEAAARAAYGDIQVYTAGADATDRAIAGFDQNFCLKVFCHRGFIVGAWCTGHRAGEIIAPLQFLMGAGIPFKKYASVVQAYPGYGEVLRRLAKAAMVDGILNHPLVKLFRK